MGQSAITLQNMGYIVLAPSSAPSSRFSRLFGEEDLAEDYAALLSAEFSMGSWVSQVVIPELVPDARGREAGWIALAQRSTVRPTAGEARANDDRRPMSVRRVTRDTIPRFLEAVECGMYLDEPRPTTVSTMVRSLSDEDFPHVRMPAPEEFDPYITVVHRNEVLAVEVCLHEARKLRDLRSRLSLDPAAW